MVFSPHLPLWSWHRARHKAWPSSHHQLERVSAFRKGRWGFPHSSVGKESTRNAWDLGSIHGLGRSPGEGKGYPLQYSGLENSMDCMVHHGVAKSRMVNEWQCHDCIWHDTESICVIKPTWLTTSQLMYVWNHTHCTHDTIGTLYGITSTLAENTPLFVCHGTLSVYEITCIIYDV